jgi:hypothetical protein
VGNQRSRSSLLKCSNSQNSKPASMTLMRQNLPP